MISDIQIIFSAADAIWWQSGIYAFFCFEVVAMTIFVKHITMSDVIIYQMYIWLCDLLI